MQQPPSTRFTQPTQLSCLTTAASPTTSTPKQARIKLLRACVGLAPEPPCIERPDITASNMEFLKLELERLATEKVG